MSSDDKPKKPTPTADEINAYLEQSAARTRKRLPLAAGNAVPIKQTPAERKFRVTVSNPEAGKPAADAPAASAPAAPGSAWRPFSADENEEK